jgi:uracil-DNA glycosylase
MKWYGSASAPSNLPRPASRGMHLTSKLREQLAGRIQYYREMGIHEFYARESRAPVPAALEERQCSAEEEKPLSPAITAKEKSNPRPPEPSAQTPAAEILQNIRADIGDCRLCRLHKGRTNLVFGAGNPDADLMFIGEAPGADEDEQGLPFVGRAGQLLNNMIAAMGLQREDVYIANIIKCRPPQNRTPEREECDTCSPFLMRQIAAIRPTVIVALGAVAAKTLLAMNASMAELRGRFYEFSPRGAGDMPPVKLAVTYHPAFLLRDPRQKKEAWKDLQMVMKYLGLKAPVKSEKQ